MTPTLMMIVKRPQMTATTINHNPKILTLQLVVLPHLESLGYHNLTLFKGAIHLAFNNTHKLSNMHIHRNLEGLYISCLSCMLLCKQICNRFILDFGVHNFVICLNYYKDVICIIIYVCNYEFSNIIVNCNLSFKSSRQMKNNHFIDMYNFTYVHNLQKNTSFGHPRLEKQFVFSLSTIKCS